MNFVLREYLSSLKEDRELDSFLGELLRSMKRIPLSKTQRGRQDGVDIPAVGTDEDNIRKVFLYVIKQGNFSRKSWNSGNVTDIMPSIDDARLVYIATRIPAPFNELKKKIIVCCNGYLEQTVETNWAQYTAKYSAVDLEFDFWGIDKLVDHVEKHQMNEAVLSDAIATKFRRALAFIDLPDYDLSHFYLFLNELLPSVTDKPITKREAIKKVRLVNLCLSITHSWCDKSNNLKPCYILGERILLNTWGWLIRNDLIKEKEVFLEYFKIILNWRELAHKYVLKVKDFYQIPDGLARGIADHNEYCLVTFEQIGITAAIGLYQIWDTGVALVPGAPPEAIKQSEQAFLIAETIADILSQLIANNPASNNPRLDEHCIEISMGLTLLYETGRFKNAVDWLTAIVNYISLNVKMTDFFPLFISDKEVLDTAKAQDQKSSILIVIIAEWCLNLRQFGLYKLLREFVAESMPHLDLQLWFPEKDIDEKLFVTDATREGGTTMIGLQLPEKVRDFQMIVAEERVLFREEYSSSVNQYGTYFLAFIAFRHFRTYPFPSTWRKFMNSPFCFAPST